MKIWIIFVSISAARLANDETVHMSEECDGTVCRSSFAQFKPQPPRTGVMDAIFGDMQVPNVHGPGKATHVLGNAVVATANHLYHQVLDPPDDYDALLRKWYRGEDMSPPHENLLMWMLGTGVSKVFEPITPTTPEFRRDARAARYEAELEKAKGQGGSAEEVTARMNEWFDKQIEKDLERSIKKSAVAITEIPRSIRNAAIRMSKAAELLMAEGVSAVAKRDPMIARHDRHSTSSFNPNGQKPFLLYAEACTDFFQSVWTYNQDYEKDIVKWYRGESVEAPYKSRLAKWIGTGADALLSPIIPTTSEQRRANRADNFENSEMTEEEYIKWEEANSFFNLPSQTANAATGAVYNAAEGIKDSAMAASATAKAMSDRFNNQVNAATKRIGVAANAATEGGRGAANWVAENVAANAKQAIANDKKYYHPLGAGFDGLP